MDAQALITDFKRRGIKLIPNPPKLTVAPASKLTDSDRAAIRAAKAELLKLLEAADLHDHEEDEIDRVASGEGWNPPAEIPPAIVSEIERIESQALTLGWRRERLRNFAFWPHGSVEPRGLASVLDAGDRIAEVTSDYLTVVKSSSHHNRLLFWRTDS
jgi:hypothetical protein